MDTITLTSPATGLQFELLFDSDGNAYIQHAITQCVVPVGWDGSNISVSMDYMEFIELLSLTDAAKLAGVSRQAIYKAMTAKRLRSITLPMDGKCYVARADVERLYDVARD